jgi:hypothetical protein
MNDFPDEMTSVTINYENVLEIVMASLPDLSSIGTSTERGCAELIYRVRPIDFQKILKHSVKASEIEDLDNFQCPIMFDVFSGLSGLTIHDWPRFSVFMTKQWIKTTKSIAFCGLEGSRVCDGISHCTTDECHCPLNISDSNTRFIFYCLDDSGCISSDKVCDDVQHCRDGSDECFCPNIVQLSCPQTINENRVCLSPDTYWEGKVTAKFLNCTVEVEPSAPIKHSDTDYYNPINHCMRELRLKDPEYLNDKMRAKDPYSYASLLCKNNCSHGTDFAEGNWVSFCDRIVEGSLTTLYHFDFIFLCEENRYNSEIFHVSKLCDGSHDCGNGADEMGCPDRFYCSNHTATWVEEHKVCDNVKDCANGADECATCNYDDLSSSEFLIQSRVILAITSLMGLAIVFLNVYEGRLCYISEQTSKKGEIDKILRLQVFVYDGLMGIYLCSVVVAAIVLRFKGDYCLIERKWRGSGYCSTLGVLFSLSSHGSLIVVACISFVRCLTCTARIGNDFGKRNIAVASVIMFFMNVINAIMPVLPFPYIREVFRTGIFFKNLQENPFFDTNPVNISHLHKIYQSKYHNETDTYKALNALRNLTTKPDIFDTLEISYYGNTGLCVQNVFKVQDSYKTYKLVYCVVVVILLLTVVVTYSRIVWEDRKSKARLAPDPAAGAAAQNQAAQNNNSTALTLKVALMITTQLMGWIPLILSTIYYQYMTSNPVPPLLFEVFALVVIPINSFLNPVFNSELYKKVVGHLWVGWRWFVDKITGRPFKNRVAPVHTVDDVQKTINAPQDEAES